MRLKNIYRYTLTIWGDKSDAEYCTHELRNILGSYDKHGTIVGLPFIRESSINYHVTLAKKPPTYEDLGYNETSCFSFKILAPASELAELESNIDSFLDVVSIEGRLIIVEREEVSAGFDWRSSGYD